MTSSLAKDSSSNDYLLQLLYNDLESLDANQLEDFDEDDDDDDEEIRRLKARLIDEPEKTLVLYPVNDD
jgi:hypothetical protein